MRTPVVVVTGQSDSEDIAGMLLSGPGTALVEHRFDGHVVHRRTTLVQRGGQADGRLGARTRPRLRVLHRAQRSAGTPATPAPQA